MEILTAMEPYTDVTRWEADYVATYRESDAILAPAIAAGERALTDLERRRHDRLTSQLDRLWSLHPDPDMRSPDWLVRLDNRTRRRKTRRAEPRQPPPEMPKRWELQAATTGRQGTLIRETAFHEAGHLVEQALEGGGFGSVRLNWSRANSSAAIECRGGSMVPPPGRSGSLCRSLAGMVATDLAGLTGPAPDCWLTGDRRAARRAAHPSDMLVSNGFADARALVAARLRLEWAAVNAIALALLDRGEVTAPEARDILARTLTPNGAVVAFGRAAA